MLIRSRAPVRIDFAGGWTDVPLFAQDKPGAVVNAAINIYTYVTVKKLPDKRIETNSYGYKHFETVEDTSIKIYSADFDIYQEAADIKELEYNGNIDLAKAAIRKTNGFAKQNGAKHINGGLEVITRSNAPAGSGLGSSAAMGVALTGTLSQFNGATFLPYEFAEMASSIERHELSILGGKQDQYASAMGGINFMEFFGEEVKCSKLQIPQEVLYELEKNLVLCYTGKSRLSSDIHQKVTNAYLNEERETVDAMDNLRQIAHEMKASLLKGNLTTFGKLLNENWENQKRLHPSITNPQIDALFEISYKNGALGGKACGAGGGGCLLFYCESDKEHTVRKKLEEAEIKIIDFNFDFTGLQIWKVH